MGEPVTAGQIAHLRQLHETATRGPWGWRGHDDGLVELRGHGPYGRFDGRVISALRSEPCIVLLADESVALAYGACEPCRAAFERLDVDGPDHRCAKPENLGTVWLKGEHAIEPANTWAVREQPYRVDVARVDHPDAELIAEARNALPGLLDEIERQRIAIHGCACPAPYDQCTHDEPLVRQVNRLADEVDRCRPGGCPVSEAG